MDKSGNIRELQPTESPRPDEVLLTQREAADLADWRPEQRHEQLAKMRAQGSAPVSGTKVERTLATYAGKKERQHRKATDAAERRRARAKARSRRNTSGK